MRCPTPIAACDAVYLIKACPSATKPDQPHCSNFKALIHGDAPDGASKPGVALASAATPAPQPRHGYSCSGSTDGGDLRATELVRGDGGAPFLILIQSWCAVHAAERFATLRATVDAARVTTIVDAARRMQDLLVAYCRP